MQVRVLGPLELVHDGSVRDVRGAGERALLAALATAPGRTLTKSRLIDHLWGESLPANPDNALQLRASKLRKVIGSALVTEGRGYRLELGEEDVDAAAFARLVAQRRFAEALALWRGPALAEFNDQAWARAEAARLEEMRAAAVEEHVDEQLHAGQHGSLVAELERQIAQAPLRERLRAQHMLALHRCGRTADALAAYHAFRRLLNDELGVDPSHALRELEVRMLREDPSLESPRSESPAGNLPRLLSSVIGREAQVQRLHALLSSTRMVTVTGPGGVGKTTMAIATARRMVEHFHDGAWFVPLAAVTDPARVADAVVDALGLVDPDSSSGQKLATAWLASRHALLVVDNCEHLADACATFLEELLRRADDHLRVLVTSREALGVPGEVQIPLPPLDEPDAVRLFTERAISVDPDFVVSDGDVHVRRICERLDGMPLAIELAAARVRTLTPEQLAARLDDRFRLLTLAPRTAEARHQTLRATIDWSHDLLDDHEAKLLRRLAVFRQGWTLEAAEAICADDSAREGVLDVLAHLVDRSLIVAARGRFRMLETIRAYAEERLVEAGEAGHVARRHAHYFTAYAEAAEPHLRGSEQTTWLERLRAEDANLRLAMLWAHAACDREPDLALRLGGALGWYWYVGRQVDGSCFLRTTLEMAGEASQPARARALQALSLVVRPVGCIVHPTLEGARAAEESAALFRANHDHARAAVSHLLVAVEGVGLQDPARHLEMVHEARAELRIRGDAWGQALAAFVEMEIRLHHGEVDHALALGSASSAAFDALDDDWGRSAVLLHLGYGLRLAGRLDEAEDVLHRAVVLSRAGLPNNLARSVVELGEVELARGAPDAAQPWLDECEQIARDLGNDTLLALADLGRGTASRLRGDPTAAASHYRRALDLAADNDFPKGFIRARVGLASAQLDLGAAAEIRDELQAALTDARRLGDSGLAAGALEQLARVASADGDAGHSQRLLTEADLLRADGGRPRALLEDRDVATAVTPARR